MRWKHPISLRNGTPIPIWWRIDNAGQLRRVGPAEVSISNEKNQFDNPTIYIFADREGRPVEPSVFGKRLGILFGFGTTRKQWTGGDIESD